MSCCSTYCDFIKVNIATKLQNIERSADVAWHAT